MSRPAVKRDAVIQMVEQGMSNAQIANRLGVTTQRVATIKHEARGLGLLAPVQPAYAATTVSDILADRGSRIGSLRQVVDRLDGKVSRWLVDQTPNGGSIADVIVAIVNDTYAEEHDA